MKSVAPFAASSAWNGNTSSRTQFASRSPFSACAHEDQRSSSRGTVSTPSSGALRGLRSRQSPSKALAWGIAPGRRAARTRAASAASYM